MISGRSISRCERDERERERVGKVEISILDAARAIYRTNCDKKSVGERRGGSEEFMRRAWIWVSEVFLGWSVGGQRAI